MKQEDGIWEDFDVNASNVLEWANQKGLIKKENSAKQMLKVTEEIGEVAAAIARDDKEELTDAIGDSFVTLIILAFQNGLEPAYCLQQAYDVIKNRTGKTVNGVFVKDGE